MVEHVKFTKLFLVYWMPTSVYFWFNRETSNVHPLWLYRHMGMDVDSLRKALASHISDAKRLLQPFPLITKSVDSRTINVGISFIPRDLHRGLTSGRPAWWNLDGDQRTICRKLLAIRIDLSHVGITTPNLKATLTGLVPMSGTDLPVLYSLQPDILN